MTAYIKSTDFAVKDVLLTGNPNKLVRGSEVDVEFNNLAIADVTNLKQTSIVGSAILPTGNDAQRDTFPLQGYTRFNTSIQQVEVYTASGWQDASGALGGSVDRVFFENDIVVTSNYTITSGRNAGTFGPVTINSGVIITVPSGSNWTIA
jgi:hypothetical protein